MAQTYLHHLPGRLRVRCATLKRNPRRAADATRLLEMLQGIESLEVNPLTGSLTISYDRDQIDGPQIMAALHRHGYCRQHETPTALPSEPATPRVLDKIIGNAGSTVGKMVLGMLVEKAVERSAVALIGALL